MSSAIRVDLHIHTQASDGVWTPPQLLEQLRQAQIRFFAVTDHDNTANVEDSRTLAGREGLLFLPAVEINTMIEGRIVHILGYDIAPATPQLQELLTGNRSLMDATDYKILRILEQDGYPVDWEAFEHYSYDRSRGGFRGLNFCIDQGFCTDVSDFFSRLFGLHRKIPFPNYPHPREAISAITAAGGVPVMAHPFGSIGHQEQGDSEALFTTLLENGIRGLECHTPYHSAEHIAAARAFCDRHRLLITGGSDTHGHFTVRRSLGHPKVTTDDLRIGELRERATVPFHSPSAW